MALVCGRYYSTPFTYIISRNPHNNPVRRVLLSSPFHETEAQSGYGNLPKVIQLVIGRGGLSNARIYALTYNGILLLKAFQFEYFIHLHLFSLRSEAELQFLLPNAWPTIPIHIEDSIFVPQI